MTTAFALLCARCGLSQREAAEFLDMRQDSVASYFVGRRRPPPGAIENLRDLYAVIEDAAEKGLAQIDRLITDFGEPAEPIELGIVSDDYEARSPEINLPCIGAHAAMLGIIVARADIPIVIVPRGSTPATAAAIDAHERKRS